jgi:hypothetical protein
MPAPCCAVLCCVLRPTGERQPPEGLQEQPGGVPSPPQLQEAQGALMDNNQWWTTCSVVWPTSSVVGPTSSAVWPTISGGQHPAVAACSTVCCCWPTINGDSTQHSTLRPLCACGAGQYPYTKLVHQTLVLICVTVPVCVYICPSRPWTAVLRSARLPPS